MTSPLRIFAASSAAAVLLLALAACSQTPTESASPSAASSGCAGVTVVVDASALDLADDPSTSTCVATDKTIAATDALAEAHVTTAGTTQYGDQVVCRVNGVPAEDQALKNPDGSDYFEKCEGMPAAFAYWSMWVQPSGGEWEYAQEGLSTLQLKPGEGLALLFTLNGLPASPTATP
ncbi:hypothetical protein ACH3VR_00960 [Microbacterium sp. B2969]|uniref:DUF4430 domain-containing protein n=1 Tax=Microbacterium alkaliflavum TaxID=3248839 RepID=A0ABW7Q272_9MICO